jgi:hypothetical protein
MQGPEVEVSMAERRTIGGRRASAGVLRVVELGGPGWFIVIRDQEGSRYGAERASIVK